MNARERLLVALDHREPDRVPFDLGGTVDSGIHVQAYRQLLQRLGLNDDRSVTCAERIMNIAVVDDDVAGLLGIDTVPVLMYVVTPNAYYSSLTSEGDYEVLEDAFGVKWFKPLKDGLYYDPRNPPLGGKRLTVDEVSAYPWPSFSHSEVASSLDKAIGQQVNSTDRAIVLGGCDAGILERATWLRGFQGVVMDLHTQPGVGAEFLGAITDIHIAFWEAVLDVAAEAVDVAVFSDDLGAQERAIVSPDWYRRCLKPYHKRLFSFVKKKAPHVRIFFHTCGAVYELIADLIDTGIDILNPLQLSAAGMNPKEIKKQFGRELTLWGGAVDSQSTLPRGTPRDVREETKRNLDSLAPGGGYVFSPVHNIQPDVPIENFMAMWEAMQQYGRYN